MKEIRSKHNSLLNYFIYDNQDLAPGYVRSCQKFLRNLSGPEYDRALAKSLKPQAASAKRHEKDIIK